MLIFVNFNFFLYFCIVIVINIQISQLNLVNVYNRIRHNKIHLHQYYPNERDNTFIIVRLNIIIDINDRIVLLD
jgi:hypothetical protein